MLNLFLVFFIAFPIYGFINNYSSVCDVKNESLIESVDFSEFSEIQSQAIKKIIIRNETKTELEECKNNFLFKNIVFAIVYLYLSGILSVVFALSNRIKNE